MLTLALRLKPKEFEQISKFVYKQAGIRLKQGKEELVRTRLAKRIISLGLGSFQDYLRLVEQDRSGHELTWMLDALTTNKTSFYREADHFQFLREQVFPALQPLRRIRIWSAGCSTGEEPVTIALEARECFADIERRDFRILATDLSTAVLQKAKLGIFAQESLQSVPRQLVRKYFQRCKEAGPDRCRLCQPALSMIAFARLNLMGQWPIKGPFQFIFCRNVMIYFDKPTQERLVNRFHKLLCPGGYLLIGHSESLTGLTHPYRFIQPAVFQRQG
ncbi:MAG: protein-glutamate O-methyltransferase CheR [Acidobacteriota bacterium]